METLEYQLSGDYIELFKLLKIMRISSSGGEAKVMIENGDIKLNGQIELRKRAKLRVGSVIQCGEKTIRIT